jgi:hypothetical protein
MKRTQAEIRAGLDERVMQARSEDRSAQIRHNAALKRHYAVGTRVHSLKSDRDGVIVWYGRSKQKVLGQGLPRIGVKFDGQTKAAFIGTGDIVRKDGLHLEDTEARRSTPVRRFRVRSTTGYGCGMLEGTRTVGDMDLSDEEFARLSAIAREHDAGALVIEVAPGTVREFDARDREQALADARRAAERRGVTRAIVLISLDGTITKIN